MRTVASGTYVTVSTNDTLKRSSEFDAKWAKEAFVAMLSGAGITGTFVVRADAGIHGSPGRARKIRFKLKQGGGPGRPIIDVNWQSGHNGTAFSGTLTGSSIDAVEVHDALVRAYPGGVYTYQPARTKSFEPDDDTLVNIALELCALAGSREDRAVETTGLSKVAAILRGMDATTDDLLRWLVKEGYALSTPSSDLFAYIEPSLFRVIDPGYGVPPKQVVVDPPVTKPVVGAIGILQELKALRATASRHRELLERIATLEARSQNARDRVAQLLAAQKELEASLTAQRQEVAIAEAEIRQWRAEAQNPEMLAAVEALAEFETLFRAGS
jgi:hypothetical protein